MSNDTKDWSDMTVEYMNTWTDTSTKMWQSWFDLMGSIPTNNSVVNGEEKFKELTEKVLDNKSLFVNFFKLSAEAWKDIFPKIETGDDWQNILIQYTNKMKEELNQLSSSYLKSSQNAMQLWQLYLGETEKFSKLWINPLGLSKNSFNEAMNGDNSPLIELNNFYWNLLYEESFGSLMQSPLLGPSREVNAKLLSGFEGWKELYKTSIDYQLVLGDIQIKSFSALMKDLVSRAEKGENIKDWKEFQTIYSQIADQVFEEAFCDEKNIKIRGNFLNALNIYRIKQQEIMELFFEMMNIPTRKEVDEMHKTIYELRKEVKQLKKQLIVNNEELIIDN